MRISGAPFPRALDDAVERAIEDASTAGGMLARITAESDPNNTGHSLVISMCQRNTAQRIGIQDNGSESLRPPGSRGEPEPM
jgi:hypothetical protein